MLACFTWAAQAEDGTSAEDRLAKIEKRLDAIEARLRTLPATGTVPAVPAPPKQADPPQGGDEQSVTVYATPSGTKYHKAGCSYLRGGGTPMTLAAARAKGLTPCSRCNPP